MPIHAVANRLFTSAITSVDGVFPEVALANELLSIVEAFQDVSASA